MVNVIILETLDKPVDPMETILFTDIVAKNIRDSKVSHILPLMKFIAKDSLLNLNRKAQFDTAKRIITNYARKN